MLADSSGSLILAIAVTGLVVALGLSFVPTLRTAAAYRFARSVGLNLPPEIEPAVRARLTSRVRGGCLGAVVALVAAAAALQFWVDVDAAAPLAVLLLIGAVFAGYAVGAAGASLRSADHDPDRIRVARSRAVGVPDFLAPVELVGARVVVAVGFLVATATVVVGATGGAPTSGNFAVTVLLAGAGVVTLVAFEIVSRRVVARPQPAGTPSELVWDDAVRSTLLRDLVTAPLAFGMYATLYGLVDFAGGIEGNYSSLGAAFLATSAVFAPLALVSFAAIVTLALKPQRHFARRLWPTVPSQSGVGN